ncbi:MAG: hypothetical protein R2910_11410 [Gemmatimonadales bacterium]|jgi:hypothetical protein
MSRRRYSRLVVLWAALLASPGALPAQTVTGIRDLTFGTVIPGVPTTILQTDAVNAGQFRIAGVFIRNVTITFTLPTVMNRTGPGPASATMPITFLNNSAGYTTFLQGNTPFNPNAPYGETVIFNATITLGGRVNPSPTQLGGSYAATIVMTVIFL